MLDDEALVGYSAHIDAIVVRSGGLLEVDRMVDMPTDKALMAFVKFAAEHASDPAVRLCLSEGGLLAEIKKEVMRNAQ